MPITTFKFALDTWQHLYSLQQAIQQAGNLSGNRLNVRGIIRNETLFDKHDMPIQLSYSPSEQPLYKKTDTQQTVFGQLLRGDVLSADIQVNPHIFRELKQNLIEYMSIEGIHIIVTIGLSHTQTDEQPFVAADIVQLDYAMKGDGGL